MGNCNCGMMRNLIKSWSFVNLPTTLHNSNSWDSSVK